MTARSDGARVALEKCAVGRRVHSKRGGGFHRYSTDEQWLVPHFDEDALRQRAPMRLAVDTCRVTDRTIASPAPPRPRFAAYVAREMTDESGGFYATQDADRRRGRRKFFVWTADEARRGAPGDDGSAAKKRASRCFIGGSRRRGISKKPNKRAQHREDRAASSR